MVKVTDKKIKWAVVQVINKGESTELVAVIYGVSTLCIEKNLRIGHFERSRINRFF
jgi:hypothetical protein